MPGYDEAAREANRAAREANRERRRRAHEELMRPPTPQERREADRRAALDVIGCLIPTPAVAAVAGVAVVIAGEAIPIALAASLAGTLTGWLVTVGLLLARNSERAYRGVAIYAFDLADPYLPLAAAIAVTLLVSFVL